MGNFVNFFSEEILFLLIACIAIKYFWQSRKLLARQREFLKSLESKEVKLRELEALNAKLLQQHQELASYEDEKKQIQRERELLIDLNMLVGAIDTVYPRVTEVNLTKNTLKNLAMDSFLKEKFALICFDEAIKIAGEMVPEGEQREGFFAHFARERQISAYNKGEKSINYIHQQLGDDGAYHWMQTQVIFVNGATDDVMQVSFARCIDEDIAQKELIEQAKNKAEAANMAKTTFLFNMSHDIRTPMNAIIGFINILEQNINEPQQMATYIKKLKTSSDFLLELINNVLDMAKLESGKLSLNEDILDLNKFKEDIQAVFEKICENKHIEFEYNMKARHQYIYADILKCKQIWLNIISNACKYTNEGGKVRFQIEELDGDRPGWKIYRSYVEDTGIGISEEYRENIFEAFSRDQSVARSQIIGSGLGMYIVKSLIDLMGGSIEIESSLGYGTKVIVSIPHKIVDEALVEAEDRSLLEENNYESLAGKRILLVEDNDINAEIAEYILTNIGIEVDRAEDGVICVDMMEKSPAEYYDLILMDVQMPNMNGYKASNVIRNLADKQKAEIPIIAMTANAFEEDKKNALEAGMNSHVAKPINVDVLLNAIKSLICK